MDFSHPFPSWACVRLRKACLLLLFFSCLPALFQTFHGIYHHSRVVRKKTCNKLILLPVLTPWVCHEPFFVPHRGVPPKGKLWLSCPTILALNMGRDHSLPYTAANQLTSKCRGPSTWAQSYLFRLTGLFDRKSIRTRSHLPQKLHEELHALQVSRDHLTWEGMQIRAGRLPFWALLGPQHISTKTVLKMVLALQNHIQTLHSYPWPLT